MIRHRIYFLLRPNLFAKLRRQIQIVIENFIILNNFFTIFGTLFYPFGNDISCDDSRDLLNLGNIRAVLNAKLRLYFNRFLEVLVIY